MLNQEKWGKQMKYLVRVRTHVSKMMLFKTHEMPSSHQVVSYR